MFYDLFDVTAYFLITFKDIIDIGLFTDLTFLLIKKNSQKRSEDLLYHYRHKLHDQLSHITVSHLQKVLFILSRSPFPFSERYISELLFTEPNTPRNISKLRTFEIGSIIPSLAKSRFNNTLLLDYLGKELISKFKDDYQLLQPHFLKVLVERVMSLDYKDT